MVTVLASVEVAAGDTTAVMQNVVLPPTSRSMFAVMLPLPGRDRSRGYRRRRRWLGRQVGDDRRRAEGPRCRRRPCRSYRTGTTLTAPSCRTDQLAVSVLASVAGLPAQVGGPAGAMIEAVLTNVPVAADQPSLSPCDRR